MSTDSRFITLQLTFLVLVVWMVVRMADLQLASTPVVPSTDQDQLREQILPAIRGEIIDRQGEVLASSLPQLSLIVEPNKLNTTSDNFISLARLIDARPSALRRIIRGAKDDQTVFLKRRLPLHLAEPIRSLKVYGLHIQHEYRRLYPEAATTAHVLGLTDEDGRSLGGVEQSLNSQLQGTPGAKKVLRDVVDKPRFDFGEMVSPESGNSIQLAIDLRLQNWAYRDLQKVTRETRAKSASVLLVNAANGEIMVMANLPSFDPNSNSQVPKKAKLNPIATNAIHPGDAIIPILLAAALDSKLIDSSKIWRMSNSEFIAAMDAEYLRNTLQKLGFGSKTGVHLAGEVAGQLPEVMALTNLVASDTTKNTDLLLATPLQLALAFTVFTRQGELTDLSLLKRGTALAKDANGVKPRVLDRQTTAQFMAMMRIRKERVEISETAQSQPQLFQFLGWAGKIHKPRKRGFSGNGRNHRSRIYIGMAPLNNPQVIGVVVLHDMAVKRGKKAKHRTNTAPAESVFVSLAEAALHLLGVPPQLKQPLESSDITLISSPLVGDQGRSSASYFGMALQPRGL